MAELIDQYVLWLDIPVNHAILVYFINRGQYLRQKFSG